MAGTEFTTVYLGLEAVVPAQCAERARHDLATTIAGHAERGHEALEALIYHEPLAGATWEDVTDPWSVAEALDDALMAVVGGGGTVAVRYDDGKYTATVEGGDGPATATGSTPALAVLNAWEKGQRKKSKPSLGGGWRLAHPIPNAPLDEDAVRAIEREGMGVLWTPAERHDVFIVVTVRYNDGKGGWEGRRVCIALAGATVDEALSGANFAFVDIIMRVHTGDLAPDALLPYLLDLIQAQQLGEPQGVPFGIPETPLRLLLKMMGIAYGH